MSENKILTPNKKSYIIQADKVELNNITIFKNLNFKLKIGECTCLMGISGVGKTTLLRLVAGIIPRDNSNNIVGIRGDNFNGKISYMAQDDLLLPWLNVINNVILGQRLRREKYLISKAKVILESVGLGDRVDSKVSTLSGGMRQRVSLARTLMEDRPIILMDEPFSALDTISRVKIQDVASNSLSGRTVLLVTHDPMEAFRVAHNIIVLSGRPARFSGPITPEGNPPRSIKDQNILTAHAELLENLKTL